MARPERFELPTYSSGGCRSIQLSYGRVVSVYIGAEELRSEGDYQTEQRKIANSLQPAVVTGSETNAGTPLEIRTKMDSALSSSPAVSASAAPASTCAFGFRPRFVDVDRAPADLCSVKSSDGLFPLFCIGHFYEREPARTSSVTVGENAYAIYLSVCFERMTQLVLGGVEAEIPYKNIFHGGLLPVREPGRLPPNRKRFDRGSLMRRKYSK